MTSLRDEIKADIVTMPTQCRVCRWLAGLPAAEADEWRDVLGDRSIQHVAILRALDRRDAPVNRGSVEHHRQRGHR